MSSDPFSLRPWPDNHSASEPVDPSREAAGAAFPRELLAALWAPWRAEYYEAPRPVTGDFLLEAAQTSDDAAHLVLRRRKTAFLMMNRYPYAVGHLMVVPYRKVADLGELADEEKLELWGLAEEGQRLLRTVLKAQGFNVGLNIGSCAGAGVPDHLHLHVVPRWSGDVNFMAVISGTRVLTQASAALYEKLAAEAAQPPHPPS